MKKFLKRVNRGIILGAVALIVLIIYLVVDYSTFGKEKSQIKETLENYIASYYDGMEQNDYDGLRKLVNDTWTSKPVMTSTNFWYEGIADILYVFDDVKSYSEVDEYGEIEHSIKKMSIKKSGPNMAYATVRFSADVEFGAYGEPIHPFAYYFSYWYDKEYTDDNRYIHSIDYEYQIYLVKENGQWRISQSTGYETSYMQQPKEDE